MRLVAVRPARVVLEATGGYETGVVAELGAAGRPVVVVNPRQVRDLARATGQLAQTDARRAPAGPVRRTHTPGVAPVAARTGT